MFEGHSWLYILISQFSVVFLDKGRLSGHSSFLKNRVPTVGTKRFLSPSFEDECVLELVQTGSRFRTLFVGPYRVLSIPPVVSACRLFSTHMFFRHQVHSYFWSNNTRERFSEPLLLHTTVQSSVVFLNKSRYLVLRRGDSPKSVRIDMKRVDILQTLIFW